MLTIFRGRAVGPCVRAAARGGAGAARALAAFLAAFLVTAAAVAQVPDLTINKSHAGSFTQGQVGAQYTIIVTNSGGAAVVAGNTVTVVDTLPVGLTATAMSGPGWTCNVPTLTCTRSDALPAGSSYFAITLTVSVAGNAGSPLVNSVTVSGGGETNTANDTATDSTVVLVPADLSVTKTHVGNFTQGQVGAQYTITVKNAAGGGPVFAGNTVTVVDTLPPGLTATAMSGPGWTCDVPTLTCTRSDALPAGSSYFAITLTVTVAGNAGSPLVNSVTVSGGGETNTSNDTASDSTIVVGPADLTITKTHAGNFAQGQVGAQYTITVGNAAGGGPVFAGNTVTVVDTLPLGLTATAITGPGWTCDLPTLTCTRSDALAAGSNYFPITLTVNVAGNASSPQVNSVTVSGGGETNTSNDTASDSTIVVGPADLTITKTHAGNFAQGQVGAQYTITVGNAAGGGPVFAGNTVTVVDTLPLGLTATAMIGPGWTCDVPTVTCTRSDALPAGSSYFAITLTVNVAGNASSPQVNSATVSGGGETNTSNDTATDSTIITLPPDLVVAKTHVGNFGQGQVGAHYSITVGNAAGGGAITAGNLVTMVDSLPTGLTATALSGTGWSCVVATVTCTRSDALAAGANYPVITLTVNVAGNASSPQVNSVTVSGGGEANTSNDTVTDSTVITLPPDLTVTKTHAGNFTQAQTGAQYSITVHADAAGTDVVAGNTVTVVDALPSGLTASALSGTGWSCVVATITCTRSDALTAGSNYPVITLTVSVANNAGSPLVNSVTVSGGGETNTGNDTATDSTTVSPGADLIVAKTHVGNFTQGQVGAQYTITVGNAVGVGPVFAGNTVTVVDTLPVGLTATALSGSGWSCVVGTITCTRSDALAAGANYPPITLTVTVAASAGSPLLNLVTVSGGGETNTANDTTTDSTIINGMPPALQGAVSRKAHGSAGTFDLPLSSVLINPTTEPRRGPTHTLVLTFDKPVTAAVAATTEGTATAGAPTFSGNDVVVDLTGVADQQYVTLALTGIASADGGSGGSATVRVGYLVGDVNQSRVVTVADLGLVNAQLTQTVTPANYLKDVNASGTLTVADKGITNANLTRALPPP